MYSERVGRNWRVISQVKNPFLRLAMATLESGRELQALAAVFPMFTTNDGKDVGAIPLSELLRRAESSEYAAQSGVTTEEARQQVVSIGEADELPVQKFIVDGRDAADPVRDRNESRLPKELDHLKAAKFGDKFEWMGHRFVVLENVTTYDIIFFVPAACVLDDLSEGAVQAEQRRRRSRELCGND